MTRYETLITRLESTLPSVNPEELQQLMSSASPPLVVDVRDMADHQLGAISGSINLPRAKLEASIESHMSAADQKVILYFLTDLLLRLDFHIMDIFCLGQSRT